MPRVKSIQKRSPKAPNTRKAEARPTLKDGPDPSTRNSFPIVGIGCSAGGLEAFKQLLKGLPPNPGMAFVLVQHLDPGHESLLAKLLSKATDMQVSEVTEGMAVERNHVYVIPPNKTMGVLNGVLHLMAREEPGAKHLPIDFFLRTLAEESGSRAIGVILSGAASDGTLGLKAIKAEGGITFAQDERTAKYDSMPRSAIAAGCVDFVLPPEDIGRELARIGRHPYLGLSVPALAADLPAEREEDLPKIFLVLRHAKGVDFTYYKASTIKRRIARRMLVHKVENFKQYLKRLHGDPAEVQALFDDILIHVTGFFREPEAFQELKERIFPRIMQGKAPGAAVRVWIPGCSTGEEAYSIAIAYLEYAGDRATETHLQIFGTDIGEAAIEKARVGIYPESALSDVSADRLRRFFVKVQGGYQIAKSVREMCIFARQDLTKDPPFSKLDLVSCRNVLIYMGAVLQKKILSYFHYALQPTGFLLLGKSESISGFAELFAPAGRKHKIYSKRVTAVRPALDMVAPSHQERPHVAVLKAEPPIHFDVQKEADRLVLTHYVPAGLIVDANLHILQFRGHCGPYLAPLPGQATLSLLKMVRPEFAVELRTAIHRAQSQNDAVRKDGIRVKRNGKEREVSLRVVPIKGTGEERYYLVLFEESKVQGTVPEKRAKNDKSTRPLEAEAGRLRRELQTTREYLQSIIEEHEATNEELKSANEEILSSNEELQSTNEELETAKEELQSTNEELVTVNEQQQNRNFELAQLSDDLSNLLYGLNICVVMLAHDKRIRRFTPQAEKLLNLLPSDIGRPIDNIRPNVSLQDLEALIDEVTDTMTVKEKDVQDVEGRWYSMRIRPYRTLDNRIDGVVMIFLDIDPLRRAQEELRQKEHALRAG
jgi:two-component system CheB/CheR fusion protein